MSPQPTHLPVDHGSHDSKEPFQLLSDTQIDVTDPSHALSLHGVGESRQCIASLVVEALAMSAFLRGYFLGWTYYVVD